MELTKPLVSKSFIQFNITVQKPAGATAATVDSTEKGPLVQLIVSDEDFEAASKQFWNQYDEDAVGHLDQDDFFMCL